MLSRHHSLDMTSSLVLFILAATASIVLFLLHQQFYNGGDTITFMQTENAKNESKTHSTSTLPYSKCILPKYNPWNEEQLQFFDPMFAFRKNGCDEGFIHTELVNGSIRTNKKNTTCWSSCLTWITDSVTSHGEWLPASTKLDCDVVAARCSKTNNISGYDYEMLHTKIVANRDNSSSSTSSVVARPNVILMIMDAVSMGESERVFTKSLSYMRQNLKTVSFPHFTKIAENSYPNAMPLLIGTRVDMVKRSIFGLPDLKAGNISEAQNNLEKTSHLFKWFKEKGYKTYLSENYMQGVFEWPDLKGFKTQPTDHIMNHYHRQAHVAVKALARSLSPENCFISYDAMLKHLGQFIEAYKDQPNFSLIWEAKLGHDSPNLPIVGDTLLLDFLIKHREQIDNSFFFLMADHGLRGGKSSSTETGIHENNSPMLTISVPLKLRNNSDLIEILEKNAKEIQTMWDVRASIHDILERPFSSPFDPSPISFESYDGSSIFRHQKGIRNCRTLPIPLKYCPCYYEKKQINSSSEHSILVGKAAVQGLNDIVERLGLAKKCQEWDFKQVKSIEVMDDQNVYIVVVETKTFPSVFRIMVHESLSTSSFSFDLPDRQDSYWNRGDCAGRNSQFCECIEKQTDPRFEGGRQRIRAQLQQILHILA